MVENNQIETKEKIIQVVIEIKEGDYNNLMLYKDYPYGRDYAEQLIIKGKVLPDNPTNGDMIKAIFPNCVKDNDFCGAVITSLNGETQYWKSDWWNTPYRKEGDTE